MATAVEPWVLFSLSTIFFFGLSQGLVKTSTHEVGPGRFTMLFGLVALGTQSLFWASTGDVGLLAPVPVFWALVSGICGAIGFVFYALAIGRGPVAIVGTITAGYPGLTALLAVVFLGDELGLTGWLGIVFVIASVASLSVLPPHPSAGRKGPVLREPVGVLIGPWLGLSILALFLWGIWAVPAKYALEEMGTGNFLGLDALSVIVVFSAYWRYHPESPGPISWARVRIPLLTIAMAEIGTLSYYFGVNAGEASLVTAFIALYPLVTILFGVLAYKERLRRSHIAAMAVGLFGLVLLGLTPAGAA